MEYDLQGVQVFFIVYFGTAKTHAVECCLHAGCRGRCEMCLDFKRVECGRHVVGGYCKIQLVVLLTVVSGFWVLRSSVV